MWTTTHLAFGSLVGSKVRSTWLAGVSGVISHMLLDLIPHWDYTGLKGLYFWVFLDQVSSLLIMVWILRGNPRWKSSLVAAAMAVVPDIEGATIHLGWQERYYFISHLSEFPHGIADVYFGILVQLCIILASLFLIERLKRSNVLRQT